MAPDASAGGGTFPPGAEDGVKCLLVLLVVVPVVVPVVVWLPGGVSLDQTTGR